MQLLNLIIAVTNMKKIAFKITILLTFFSLGIIEVNCQVENSKSIQEKVNLFTDRTLYISGEQIQFAAYLFMNIDAPSFSLTGVKDISELDILIKNYKKPKVVNTSKILYIELITPDGEKLFKGKYLFEDHYSNGSISISKDIATGMYYLKAYTKVMRNYGSKYYSYIPLKIVNPHKTEIQQHNQLVSLKNDSISIIDSLKNQELLSIATDKDEYLTREKISCQIKGINLKANSLKILNLSIIPEGSINESEKIDIISNNPLSDSYYYPETNGLSITGKLKESKSQNPIINKTINLSILGNYNDFIAVKTDTSGRFFIKVPNFSGVKDVFLIAENIVDSKSIINIDNDFCENQAQIPTPLFKLSDLEKKIAYNFATNSQLAISFNEKVFKDSITTIDPPFYGEPKLKRYFDNYIQLPTFEDYINEIIPNLTIRKEQGKRYFKILNPQPEMGIYKPLVLLDMVAIDNTEKLLSLSPQKISHIEIIDAAYIKGDMTYGGIISIFSKKGDFAGIDLPSSGLFVDFNFLSNTNKQPKELSLKTNRPDTRNTLAWEPNIQLDLNNLYEQSFSSADTPGRYIILLRGITSEGKHFSYKKLFIIKNRNS